MPRLVLLPGLDGTGLLFEPLLRELPAGLDPIVVRYDGTADRSIADCAARAAGHLPRDEAIVLVAESFSGPVAMRLLSDSAKHRITGLILCASFTASPRPFLLRLLRPLPLGWLLGIRPPDWSIRAACLDRRAPSGLVGLVQQTIGSVNPHVLAGRLRDLAMERSRPMPPGLPCLYIRPRADRLVPPSALERVRQQAPWIVAREVAGPHFILQTAAKECAGLIVGFLEETQGADATNPTRPPSA